MENDPEQRDLFRALREGANTFGIVTRFIFRTFRQGRLWGGTLIHPLETKTRQLQALHDFSGNPLYDPNVALTYSFGMSAERGSGFVNSIVYSKPLSEPFAFTPFISMEAAVMSTLRELSLTELTQEQDAFNENGLLYVTDPISTTNAFGELWTARSCSHLSSAGSKANFQLKTG